MCGSFVENNSPDLRLLCRESGTKARAGQLSQTPAHEAPFSSIIERGSHGAEQRGGSEANEELVGLFAISSLSDRWSHRKTPVKDISSARFLESV